MENWDQHQVHEWLRTECQFDESLCDQFRDAGIDGEVLVSCQNMHDLQGLVQNLQSGFAKKILLRMKRIQDSASDSLPQGYSPARKFKEHTSAAPYLEGTFLVDEDGNRLQESGPENPNLLYPVREFKEFTEISRENVKNFLFQVLRFVIACVNSRANGTIYFGIQDNTVNVLGTTLADILPNELSDRLLESIPQILCKNYIKSRILRNCLWNPKFIEVHGLQGKTGKHVIEIDVESKYEYVRESFFEAILSNYFDKNAGKHEQELFIRDGSGSRRLNGKERTVFVQNITSLSERRRQAEKPPIGHDRKREMLEGMLKSGNKDPFDPSTYLVLVLGKVDEMWEDELQLQSETVQDLNFIGKYCKWKLVLDLNSDTRVRSEYEKYHNTVYMTIDQFKESSCDLKNEGEIDKTWWLHVNGNDDAQRPVYRLNEWEKFREDVIITLISQLRYMSPNRCLVVFFFLSDREAIMTSIYKRFYNSEFCRILYIAEFEFALENLRKRPKDEIKIFVNGIAGLPWTQVGNIFRTVSGQPDPECEIPTSSGSLEPVKREKWNDLDILGALECSTVDCYDKTKQEYFWKERYKFYCGNRVSWLNCALSKEFRGRDRHIIKRNQHEILKSKIQSRTYKTKCFEVMTVFHHAGAGGSTLARHVMWELKEKYKCAVIKSLSDETQNQIHELYRYGEKNILNGMLKPAIFVLDLPDPEASRIFLNELKKCRSHKELVGIIIYCKRTSEENQSAPLIRAAFNHYSDIFLLQKFSREEKQQFYDVLDAIGTNPDLKVQADLMLGFMALISDEVVHYVRETIKRFLSSSEQWERQLLKFIALLNTYYSDDPDVPTAFFDFLIPSELQAHLTDWNNLNRPCGLFCMVVQKPTLGSVHCFRIKMYPIFAKELLDHVRDHSKLSDTVLEFLDCNGFKSHSYSRNNLILMTKNMIRKRQYNWTNRENRQVHAHTRYSDILNDILTGEKGCCPEEKDHQYKGALAVAKKAFEVLHTGLPKDAFLAQLVARVLYLEARQFDEALQYAKLATDLKKDNSFLLDTMGQIYKEKLRHVFPSFINVPLAGLSTAIELARNALKWFTSSVKANENEVEVNYSPYIGHVEIFKILFEVLQCSQNVFGRTWKKKLHSYLTNPDFIPTEIQMVWRDHHDFIKQLCGECECSITSALDKLTMMKPVKEPEESPIPSQQDKLIERVLECYHLYRVVVGNQILEKIHKDVTTKQAWNRNKVIQMGGLNFHTIMELGMDMENGLTSLKEMKTLLEENTADTKYRVNKSDIEKLLLVSLSLSATSTDGGDVTPLELYSLCVQYQLAVGVGTNLYNLVMSMLLWPQRNMQGISYNHQVLMRVLGDLKTGSELRIRKSRAKSGQESELKGYLRTGRKQINYKMRTVFYLSKAGTAMNNTSMQKVLYKSLVKLRDGKVIYSDDQFWQHPHLEDILSRVYGIIQGDHVLVYDEQLENYTIRVPIAHANAAHSSLNEGLVQFYIGFTWDGPVACGVGPITDGQIVLRRREVFDSIDTIARDLNP